MIHPLQTFQGICTGIRNLINGSKTTLVAEDILKPDCLISVIIPAYNEATTIVETIKNLKLSKDPNVEIILADGGSTDNTKELAANYGVQVYDSPPGRAACQNFGVKKSKGDILLFLHSDTILPRNWNTLIRNSLQDPKVLIGAFTFKIKERHIRLARAMEFLVKIRSTWKQLPYGDQALHMRKSIFDKLGGFPAQQFMEDFELCKQTRKLGKIKILDTPALSSGRRYIPDGAVFVTTFNQFIIVGYNLGIPPNELRKLYYDPEDQPKLKKNKTN